VIVEERIYTLRPGAAPDYLRLYEAEGLEVQRPTLGRLIGYFHTEIGPQNEIVHLWAYRDHAERQERRQRLLAHDRWREYVQKVRPMIVSQQNKILVPAPFSPPIEDLR
jgi:NIPSNAP